jgi:hypothetical protein
MATKEIKDWRGTRIEVGDIILYAVKHSTSVEVNEAIVREVGYKAPAWLADFRDIKDSDKNPYVLADWVLSSYCFTPNWDGEMYNYRHIKRVKLTNFEGITVVSKHRPPAFSTKQDVVHWSNT